MKFETFQAGEWRQRYHYRSFEPVPVNRPWTWEDGGVSTLLEEATRALGKRSVTGRAALNWMFDHAVLTAAELRQGLGVTQPTADAIIAAFVRLGILEEVTGRLRDRVYLFRRYIRLFTK